MVNLYKLDLRQHPRWTKRYYYLIQIAKRYKATVR
jgi:sulfur transfer protein SufE